MAAYDPSPNAVLIKQFRTGSNNYYENIELSGSSVLIHTDITGSVTGSNFTLAADTGSSYSVLVYQNYAFKLAPSTAGGTGTSGISGTSGVQGAQGASGTGTSGISGTSGVAGTSGVQGASGTSGVQGAQGASGFGTSGVQGAQGASGSGTSGVSAFGTSGVSGTSGVQGAQGASGFGTSGVQGAQGASGSGTSGTSGVQGAQGAQGAAGTGSGASLVFRTITFSGSARSVLSAFGSQSDIDNATVSFTGGNTVTISTIGSLDLYQITVNYDSNVNTGTAFSVVYPEAKGETSITTTQYPICAHYNQASPSVIQSNTNWNMSNSSGTVTVQKTGLTANAAAVFKIQF